MSYSIKEIIDIAIGLENAGYTFYTKIAEKMDNEKVKDLFGFLAGEELVHLETFKSLLTDINNYEGVFNDEYYLYLQAIGGGRIFKDEPGLEKVIENITSPLGAVKKAFSDEKEAIFFYSELKKIYENESEKLNIIDEIIEEERNHVILLWNIKESLLLL